MVDLATITVQLAVGAVPMGAAWFAYRASTDANRKSAEAARVAAERQAEAERNKVDSEAFERAKTIYDSGITLLERQLLRVQSQFDQLNDAANDERTTFMARIHSMQTQIELLESTVVLLRRQLIDAGIAPPPRDVGMPSPLPSTTAEPRLQEEM